MKFYDCRVWLTDGDTGIRVTQGTKTCIPAFEVILLRRLHNENTVQVTDVKEVVCTDEAKLKRTNTEWRAYLRTHGYSRRLIEREFDREGPLPTSLDVPRRSVPAKGRSIAVEDDFGLEATA